MLKELTEEALKNHCAILGKAGSGKTYAAKGIVEHLLDTGSRVCIIDPTSVWWGLKSKASGKSGSYPIVVFGGEHADLPLGQMHGETIAEIVATSNTPAIIDTSLMKVGERTRFFTDFASELLRKNKGPLHLFIDEAHLMAPQGRVSDPQSGAMLHAANNLVSLGRARGLRITMITQRPAKLHKDSLTQVETLIALRLIAPQDRNAVEEWIADQADPIKGREIIASLPSLPTGCGWIWSPEIGILSKVNFPKIKTFDSSTTPEGFAEGKNAPVLASIDLATISGRLSSIREEADANDPAKLKARIRELEKHGARTPEPDPNAIQRAHEQGVASGYDIAWADFEAALEPALAALAARVAKEFTTIKLTRPKRGPQKAIPAPYVAMKPVAAAPAEPGPVTPSGDLSRPEQRIVNSLAFWIGIGKETPTRQQVAAVAGYSPKSGGYNNLVGQLNGKGIISYPAPGILSLTAGAGANVMDAETAKQKLLGSLSAPERRVLAAFTIHAASRDEIAERSGYSPSSGGFNNLLGSLAGIGVIVRPAPGMVDLADWAREIL